MGLGFVRQERELIGDVFPLGFLVFFVWVDWASVGSFWVEVPSVVHGEIAGSVEALIALILHGLMIPALVRASLAAPQATECPYFSRS